MPSLTIYAAAATPVVQAQPKGRITTAGGRVFVMPWAPNEVDHGGLADSYATLARTGRKPLVLHTAEGLRTVAFTLMLAKKGIQDSIEDQIASLRAIADAAERCSITLSPMEAGTQWLLTDLSIAVSARQAGTNHATRATASLQFSEYVSAITNVGPLTGGSTTKPPVKSPTKKHVKKTLHYRVRKGDTIGKIALRFYGDANDWHRIAKASKLTHPHYLKVGQRLTIPPN